MSRRAMPSDANSRAIAAVLAPLDRAEATITATVVGRADRAAPAVRNRTQAWRPVRDHDADIASALAIDADAVIGDRRLASGEKGLNDLEQLTPVDRTAAQLEIDGHMGADRRRGRQRAQVFRMRIDCGCILAKVGEVAQRLNPAGGGAGPDRHQAARAPAHAQNALRVGRRRDRALDQRQIVWPRHHAPRRLGEIGDVDPLGEREQFVFAIEQAQLATIAGSELPHRQFRLSPSHSRHLTTPAWAKAG